MTSRPARIAAVLAALLLVATGYFHTTHAHELDQASTLHPVCTLCQFHASSATPASGTAQMVTPDAVGTVAVTSRATPAPSRAIGIPASRAPPVLLAY
ncbi:MAG TPA: hypothetical protein VFX92_05525 [Candidatus Krumholzibacteria bacterium]|nr:hypothetical protein [Candidatus Krumholzibacteria bacterium]